MFRFLDFHRELFLYRLKETTIVFSAMFAALWWINLLFPSTVPYSLFHFWRMDGSVGEILAASWGIFTWGIVVTSFLAFRGRNDNKDNQRAGGYFLQGTLLSLWAGITEEIGYRWLYFYLMIPICLLSNTLMFGLLEWSYRNITGPVSNALTFGSLGPILMGGSWAIGSALVLTNNQFQKSHKYLGLIGWINSWFVGMFMSYLMFRFGLVASILVHVIFDFLIFLVYYLDALIERMFRSNGGRSNNGVLLKI